MNRYQQLAQTIQVQIEQQVWRPGDKILSIRAASKSYAVSAATVLQAYQRLESEGWLIAKPQSGYFVASRLAHHHAKPALPTTVTSYHDQLYDYLKDSNQASIALGAAFPSPDLFPLTLLNRHLASAGRKLPVESVLHSMPPGNESLRRSIAQRYLANGLTVSHQDIVITSGAMEALNLSLATLCKAGDTVVIESPAFYGARQAVERLGLNAIEVPVDPQSGLCLASFERALQSQPVTACWLMSRFQNPTGACLSDAGKQRVVELANQYHVAIIEDDVYAELGFAATSLKPFKYYDKQDRVLLCGSLSKSLCPGYRIGWVVNQGFNGQLQKQQMLSTLSGSAPVQQGIAHYLQHESYDNHLRKLRKTLQQRQADTIAMIRQYFPADITLHSAEGGYFVWLELADDIDCYSVYTQALADGISIAYGGLFASKPQYRHCMRLNVSLAPSEQLEQALRRIGLLLRQQATA